MSDHNVTISALAPEASYEVIALPRHDWADRITAAWRSSVENIIECGLLLIDAKKALSHGEFGEMVRTELPFGERMAQMLMKVARNRVLSNPNHGSHLPASWRTLADLATLPEATVEEMIADGRIGPDMERNEVGSKPKPKSKRVATSKPESKPTSHSDSSYVALAALDHRQSAAMEALSGLAGLTKRAIGEVPVDVADIAAKWTDSDAIERIIEWLTQVRECMRTRGGARR